MLKVIDRSVAAVAALLVAATAVAVCLNVFFRYVLESGLVWADEIPGFLLVWIAFLGAYLAIRREGHIAFDLLVAKLPPRPRAVLQTLIDLLVVGFLVLLVRTSVEMIARVGGREIETAPIPQGVFMAILPIAGMLMIVGLAVRIVARWRRAPWR